MVSAAADTDRSGDVSAEEWQAFTARVDADGDGVLERRVLKAWLLLPGLDRNADGALSNEDLNLLFAAWDTSGDGSLQAGETRGGRGRRGGGSGGLSRSVVIAAADTNSNGQVSAEEWTAFVGEGGAVSIAVVAAWIATAESQVSDDRGGLSTGVILLTLDSNLDTDRNGVLAIADLQRTYDSLDRNSDGALEAGEMRPQVARGRGGRGRRGRGRGARWARPTAEDRAKPALMPFQRSLEDALAMVEATGKPLLICVIIDAEEASDAIAWVHYRDPEFVSLASGFIPVLASPDQHTARDRDDAGRRITDPKFGRVIDAEHIDIEPALYEAYFSEQRVAPRHVGVAPDGSILFDIYLVNDLNLVTSSLRDHGKPDVRIPLAETLDEQGLLASPDAGHRARLEQLYAAADDANRARLAGLALSSDRSTQHPEILHMALRDEVVSVRQRAIANLADHSGQADQQLFVAAFRAAAGDSALTARLLDALKKAADRFAADSPTLLPTFVGVSSASQVVDVEAWRGALQGSEPVVEQPLTEAELSELDRRLDELGNRRRTDPDNRDLSVQIAALTMRYARIRIMTNQDPTFLLEDVRGAARQGTSAEDPNGLALGYEAWANYLLGDMETALASASQALPHLVSDAATPVAAEVLSAFALSRTQELYTAIGEGGEWPAAWVSDIHAAYDALLDHPNLTEAQAIAYLDWILAMDADALLPSASRRAVARFPVSAEIHQRWREQLLRDGGARALERAYAELTPAPQDRAAVAWFAGFAGIVAAERLVQNTHLEDAVGAYTRSIDSFRSAVEMNSSYRGSTVHYLSLDFAGRSRARMQRGDLDGALEDMRNAIAENPASATWDDGLGNSPADTAGELYRALTAAGRSADAQSLRDLLSQHGVRIG